MRTTNRYEVRVVGDENYTSLGKLLHACDDAADAKDVAHDLASTWFYGVAVVDTVAGIIDWGDEVSPIANVTITDESEP